MRAGTTSPAGLRYPTAALVTASRALNTAYTAGRQRRRCLVAATLSSGSTVSVVRTVGGVSLTQQVMGFTVSGLAGASVVQSATFDVDPAGSYQLTTTGTVTLTSWSEVDG